LIIRYCKNGGLREQFAAASEAAAGELLNRRKSIFRRTNQYLHDDNT